MAVPLHFRNVPEYLHAPQFRNHDMKSSDSKHNETQELLQFPKSTCVLWDGTSTGSPVFLHVAQNRRPRLQLWEKVLWLIHKQTSDEGTANRVLAGSLSVEEDGEGVSFHIDGLDTRQADTDSSLALADVMIPVQVSNSRNQDRTGSTEDYIGAIKMLEKRCKGRDPVDLNNLLLVKGWCSFYSHQNSDKTVAHLQFDVVTLATVFKATPVNPVPIVPTALAKNLGGPRSLSNLQGKPKMGYLTMDHTRKLLLVLESDPKVASLPIVGMWVSGVPMVHHPFVWASCLHYLHNEQLQDRVCFPPEGFLLVMYTPLHSKPEFYEVCTTSGKPDLEFDLYTGYEITSLNKKSSGPEPNSIEWELCPVRNGPKRELFDAALQEIKSADRSNSSSGTASPAPSTSDDIIPRMTPAPHSAKAMSVKPMVPEVSMFWNDSSPSPMLGPSPFSSAPSHPPCPSSAASSTSFPASSAQRSMPSSVNGPVPSSMNTHPGARNVCVSSSSGQDCESMPRGALGYHQSLRTVHNQNNNTGVPSESSCIPAAGVRNAVYSVSAPQRQQPYTPFSQPPVPFSSAGFHPTTVPQGHTLSAMHQGAFPQLSGPGGERGYLSSQPPHPQPQPHFPHPQSSGYPQPNHPHMSHVPQHPQPQAYYPHSQQNWFPPNPHQSCSQPRLMAPAAVHHCRPSQQGQGPDARNFTIPQRPPHPGPSQPHPQTASHHPSAARQSAPWPNKPTSNPGQVFVPNGSVDFQGRSYSSSASNMPTQTVNSCPQEVLDPKLQRQVKPQCQNVSEGYLPHSVQHVSDPSSTHRTAQLQPPASQPFSYAQSSSGNPGLFAQSISSAQAQTSVNSIQPSLISTATVVQGGNVADSTQADSTSCSGKSSDDSGLSVTPDHSDPQSKAAGLSAPGVEGATAGSLQGVNWAGVPPEVVQLLVQQDAQLKVLTAQIQQLLAQQNSASPASTASTPVPSSASSTPATLKKETCSTAVNTTLLDQESPWGKTSPAQCVSVQTSPQKPASPHSQQTHPQSPASQQAQVPGTLHKSQGSPFCHASPVERQQRNARNYHASNREDAGSAGQTPSEIRHQGVVQLSSTREDGGRSTTGSFHSVASSGSQEISPARSVDSRLQASHSTPSPQSASMCGPQDQLGLEGSTGQEISPDSKEYYDQLINNIRLFLDSHSQDAESSEVKQNASAPDDATCTHLQLMDSSFAASPTLPACPSSGGASSNTTMMPHINYLSLMLASESETSLEINAMAMKYLRDEQLTQLARLHQSPQPKGGAGSNQLLRQVLAASLDATGASDVSRLGMSANNMSMATRKYMEKHGLMGDGGEGESALDTNQTLRLQTDFSLAVMSEHSSHSLPSSPQKGTNPQVTAPRSPLKREVLQQAFCPSPAIAEERENFYEDRKGMRSYDDLGASPALPAPAPRRYQYRDHSPEDTPIFPERFREAAGQRLINDCSVATEDDRILDIEKLKQMPKLL